MAVQIVSAGRLWKVVAELVPRGRFLAQEGSIWIAVDNSSGEAWVESFQQKRQALRWLRGEFDADGKASRWTRISGDGALVAAAAQQNVALNAAEAGMILGYLEGHGYCLLADGGGATVRHDEQHGACHRGDEPYSILDTITFCQEMNEELLMDNCAQRNPDVAYIDRLRKDEQVLDALMNRLAGIGGNS